MKTILLSLKRAAFRPLLWVLLIACAAAIGLTARIPSVMGGAPAGLYTEAEGPEAERITDHLLKNGFVLCDDPEAMEEQVRRGELDCAAVLPEDLALRLKTGELEGCVVWIQSPASFAPVLRQNHLTAALFREHAPYLTAAALEGTEIPPEEVLSEYETMFAQGYVFSFDVTMAGESRDPVDAKARSLAMGAAAILLCAVMLAFCGELPGGSFRELLGRLGLRAALGQIILPGMALRSVLVWLAGAVGLALAGLPELILPLAPYVLLLAGTGLILGALLPSPRYLHILLPVILIGAAALCPIYTDLALFVPALAAVRRVLPPYWLWGAAEQPLLLTGLAVIGWALGVGLFLLRYAAIGKYRLK